MRNTYKRRKFSASEDEVIVKLYGKVERNEIARQLNRSVGSVTHRAAKLGLSKKLKRWTTDEDQILLHGRQSQLSLTKVADLLGRCPSEVSERARFLGVEKWHQSSGRFRGRLIDGFHKGKAVYTHRAVMEKKIGRKLSSAEIVHHIDGNIDNNSPSNLHLFKNRSEHLKAHLSAGRNLSQKLAEGLIRFDRDLGLYVSTCQSK